MAGNISQPNYNNNSFASSSSSSSSLPLTSLLQKESSHQLEEDQTLPPPHQEKQQRKHPNNHYDHPPFPHPPSNLLQDSRRSSTTSSIIPGSGVLIQAKDEDEKEEIIPDSGSDLTTDSDEVDSQDSDLEEEEEVGEEGIKNKFSLTTNSNSNSNSSFEDVCLACRGNCRCGGAKGATVYVPVTTSTLPRIGGAGITTGGLKVKITMSSASNSSSRTSYPPSSSSFTTSSRQPIASTSKASTSSHTIIISEDEDESYSPRHSHKKFKIGGSGASTPTSTTSSSHKKGKAVKKEKLPATGTFDVFSSKETSYSSHSGHQKELSPSSSTSSTNRKSRPLPTPSRSSLRQVLAISSKDIPLSPPPIINTFTSPLHHSKKSEKIRFDQEVSDFDLDGEFDTTSNDDDEDDDDDDDSEVESGGRIEKAEERALRREFEVGNDESTEDDLSDMDEWEELRKSRSKGKEVEKEEQSLGEKNNNNIFSTFETEGEEEEEDEDVGITDLPLTGGIGVVTWSDYDISGQDEEEDDEELEVDEEMLLDEGGEFENELEELFALSEAVVGPVRDGEYESGEMWFEEISNLGDDESCSDIEEDSDEDGDTTIVVMDRWGVNYSRRARRTSHSGSSESEASDSDDYDDDDLMAAFDDDEDGGDTTDSLDSDDHVGLVRFGIEVESETEASSSDEARDLYRQFAPGTASLADVQAPTSADLASLPQYLFFGHSASIETSLNNQEDDSTAAGSDTTSGILEGVNRSLNKGKGRARVENIKEEDEDLGKVVPRSPAMGSFAPKECGIGRSKDVSVMIDESDTIAASPFSKAKKSRKRGRDLLDTTPSRRSRADSKVSTASGRSITDDSLSGEIREPASPDLQATTLDLDLHDVLHPSILQPGPTSDSATSEDSEGETGSRKRKRRQEEALPTTGLSDLSRWNRIPIGAFRSSTMPSYAPTPHFAATAEEATIVFNGRRKSGGSLNLPISTNPALRGSASTSRSSLSHTLSSPHTTSDMTKKAIERRMLCSPLLGPITTSEIHDVSPKSRKVKRKEKKSFITSPQSHGMINTTSSSTSSNRIVESYLTSLPSPSQPFTSSPFLAPQHPSSNYIPSLHSPLFRSSMTSNLE